MYYNIRSIFICLGCLSSLYLLGAINLNLWYSYPALLSCLTILFINYHKVFISNPKLLKIKYYFFISIVILSILIYVIAISKNNSNSNFNNLVIISGLISMIFLVIVSRKKCLNAKD